MYGTLQNMRHRSGPRIWIWSALAVQLVGLAFDAVWHGLLNPDFEAVTVDQMVRHLSTVHLPLYIGVLSVFVSTAWALIDQMRRSKIGVTLPVAFAGALVSTAGEIWHAYTHLQLSTHSGPIAGMTSFFGFIVVVTALWLEERHDRRGARSTPISGVGHDRSTSCL
jgi:FtsH-binding integral membrane protein